MSEVVYDFMFHMFLQIWLTTFLILNKLRREHIIPSLKEKKKKQKTMSIASSQWANPGPFFCSL